MTITDKINEIIDQRIGRNSFKGKGHLEVVKKKKKFFGELMQALQEYQSLRENMLSQINGGGGEYYTMSLEDPMLQQRVELADPSATILQLQRCLAECERLEKRFGRETINISVVGRARQGKSRLLQSISGLNDRIIPTSNGGDCTGAKSVIANNVGKTHARVVFYSEMELIEQIQLYLNALDISRNIGSISQINGLQDEINTYAEHLSSKTGKQQSLFQHFRKYVEHDDYLQYIGTIKDIENEEEIRQFVAQHDAKMKPTFAFLAVKEVCIYTEFPMKEAGKIVLVDTIGLGDTSLGIREKMVRTLRDDSDAAILVRLPSANGDSIRVEDDELYDLISDAMGKDVLDKWLFFALNVCDELGNQNSGKAMEDALNARKLNYAFIKKVNCGNSTEVEKDLMLPVLEYLSSNLSDVDNSMMTKANYQFFDCFQKYFELCAKVNNVLSGGFRKSLQSGGLFDELYEDKLGLSRKLKALMEKYSSLNAQCDVISDNVKSIIRNMASQCPIQDEIRDRLTTGGERGHAPNVYLYYADNLRAVIRDMFEEINNSTIVTLQDDFKKEVCDVLGDDDGGRLKRIPVQDTDSENPISWMEALVDERMSAFPLVSAAIKDILNYKLNIEGLLEFKVDNALSCLDYSPQNNRFVMPDFSGLSDEKIVFTIEQTLKSAIPDVANDLMTGIQELLLIPHHSFRARIRKLYDRIIFKQEGLRELKNFYRENATLIWPDEFKNVAHQEIALGQLNDSCGKLNNCRTKDMFTLKID